MNKQERISDLLRELEETIADMRVKYTALSYENKLKYTEKLDTIRYRILVANLEKD